ncbi:MAG: patatin-like phospholipase family protein [Myxococcota bacterium]|nr:patatin-like phospholipase family protein [Myxococcota bacterium]
MSADQPPKSNALGIVLSGGGARGAYVAGVIRYLYTELPLRLGYSPWPRYVSGTSVGSINGYFCACHDMLEIRKMTELWTNLHIDQMYDLPKTSFSMLQHAYRALFSSSFFDSTPFAQLVQKEASRRTLRKSISRKLCHGYLVHATHMASGRKTIFADVAEGVQIPKPLDAQIKYTKIYPEHILASTAIPMLFPPASVSGEFYLDGNLRQYAPLQPMLSMDVNRVLLLATRAHTDEHSDYPSPKTVSMPNIAGYSLNAMGMDEIERDLITAKQINTMVDWGIRTYGEDFAERLRRDTGIEKTKMLHIRPSVSLSKLAYDIFENNGVEADSNISWVLRKIHEQSLPESGSVTLSCLLFDQHYTKAAEDLGYHDAKNMSEQLIDFFGEQPL